MDPFRQRLIGSALQQTRKLMGNSQADMAGVLHVSREQISDYEGGKRELRAGDLERLAEWWEIPLPTLMHRLGYAFPREWPEFEEWYRARSGTISASASGNTATQSGGTAASGGGSGHLPPAYHPLATLAAAAPTFSCPTP